MTKQTNGMIVESFKKVRFFNYIIILVAIILIHGSCGKEDDVNDLVDIPLTDEQASTFNGLISGIDFDAETVLEKQDIVGSSQRTEGEEGYSESGDENEYLACATKSYNLKQNFDEVAILRPTDGVVYPGALMVANKNLLLGSPDPVSLGRGSMVISLDLPGMGDNGIITVENPTNSSVQAAIDNALDYWNNNAYEEGYVNAANSSFNTTVAYSFEQLALDLGLSASWIGGNASTQFNIVSSTEKKVIMLTFKQVFYKVTMDPPESPAMVFSGSVTVDDLENTFSDDAAPAYVHTVSYGRIINFRMETTSSATDAELKAAIEYIAEAKYEADLDSKYKSIMEESSVDVFTIGGNAEIASLANSSNSIEELQSIICGESAVYSKSNPGVPIAYSVRYLSDNSLATLGYTTDYEVETCDIYYKSTLRVKNSGGYVAKVSVGYTQDGQSKSTNTGNYTAGITKSITLPANAKNISIKAIAYTGLIWDPTNDIFSKSYSVNPGDIGFEMTGTTLSTGYKTMN